MEKRFIVLLLLLALICFAGCAAKPAGPGSGAPVGSETALPSETDPAQEPEAEAIVLPDFSVRTIDGTEFTLSEALKDHELVLINLWATWCGPCGMEFPYLQQAWSENADRVALIALSVEPDDTADVLREYADEMGLTFPIGREEGKDLRRFVTEGIPTTIVVDKYGRVAAVEVGAKTSVQEFVDLFDGFTGPDYDPDVCTYQVCCYDDGYGEVAGVVINFCTDVSCTPVTTNAEGVAVFSGPPAKYHVQIIKVPEGWKALNQDEWYSEPYAQTFWVPFERDSK